MNIQRFSVAAGLFIVLTGTCATAAGQGTIAFHGSIVEPGCLSNAHNGSVMELTGCPSVNRGGRIDVRNVTPVASVKAVGASSARAVLLTDTGSNGRYYDQRYQLVDGLGKPIRSGAYVVTLTSP
ncbi:hypothetical protein BFW86_16525 [Pseudomonas fluorescens]|nr:hypothetical protein BFW86_16525 [Pseudomonas fluorescens]